MNGSNAQVRFVFCSDSLREALDMMTVDLPLSPRLSQALMTCSREFAQQREGLSPEKLAKYGGKVLKNNGWLSASHLQLVTEEQ